MAKQLIHESKFRLIDFVFQNLSATKSSVNILESLTVINDHKNLIYSSKLLSKDEAFVYHTITPVSTSFSYIELSAPFPFYLKFAVQSNPNNIIELKTASFSYNNQDDKLINIQIANGTFSPTFLPIETTKDIDVKYILIEHIDLVYTTTYGDLYV
jgi:hypothetical protein